MDFEQNTITLCPEKWSSPPLFTVLHVNALNNDSIIVIQQLENFLSEKPGTLKNTTSVSPRAVLQHDIMKEVVIIKSTAPRTVVPHCNAVIVIVDKFCGAAVLRGSDVYAPGVLAAPSGLDKGDHVSVYTDVGGKCLRGSTAPYLGDKFFVGNGVASMSRSQLFCNNSNTVKGVAIQITESLYGCPSLGDFMPDVVFLQNLPSIVCGHVVNPQPGDIVLDMCAAPGGKTIHMAALMKDKGVLIALDKTQPKVDAIVHNAARFNLSSVAAYKWDSTKAVDGDCPAQPQRLLLRPPFAPGSFDKILLDAPCSALGQRPQLARRNLKLNELQSFPKLQKNLFRNAVQLLKVGGILVYSTCTTNRAENEGIVEWALSCFDSITLVKAEPLLGGIGRSDDVCDNNSSNIPMLSADQLECVQNFGPHATNFRSSAPHDLDTIGFFIAKFLKLR